MNPWLGMSLVAGSFAVLMGGLKLAGEKSALPPEASRKFVHMGMGLVTLTFPWLFRNAWPVWLLSGGFVAVLAGIRLLPPLHQRFGRVLGGVERQSWGEFYFPVAVAIVFSLARNYRDRYVIPILVVTLADATAALVGTRFGRTRYQTEEGCKTLEGSLALFVVTVPSVVVPAVLLTKAPVVQVAIMAVCIGVLAALVEAISWRGSDNLFLPLATFVMLVRFAGRTDTQMLLKLIVALGLLLLLVVWRHRTTLQDNALAGATLALYLYWTVGGWDWLVPPLTLTLAYTFLPFRPQRVSRDTHGNVIVLSLGVVGLFWLFLDRGLGEQGFRLPYVLSFAAQLSMIFLARWKRGWPETSTVVIIFGATFAAWLIAFVPALIFEWSPISGRVAGLAFGVIGMVTILFSRLVSPLTDMPNTLRRWLIQAALAFIGSAAGLLQVFKP